MAHSTLDVAVRTAIGILMDRRKTWSLITYEDLADRIGYDTHNIRNV
jgi:hypothetical protein